MFTFFLTLTIISGIALIVGFVWWLTASGTTTRRGGPIAGTRIAGRRATNQGEVRATFLEKPAFAGEGIGVEREAEVSGADLKRMLRQHQWRAALPPLLTIVGMGGLIVFGALALWLRLDNKLVATVIVAVAWFTMARIAVDFVRG